MTLVYISAAWLAGIFLGSKVDLPVWLLAIGLAPLAVLIFYRGNTRAVILGTVCLITLVGAALYFPLRLPATDNSAISYYHEQAGVTLKGVVSSPPETGGQYARLRFTAREIKTADRWQKISGTALVYVPAYSEYRYGDRLLLNGQPETPPRFDDFDYRDYLAHQGISTIIYYPKIEVLSRNQGSRILGWVYSLRGNIPPEMNRDFSRTGTTHILAISGLNLGIIAGIFLSLGLWLFGRRRYYYVWLALGSIWCYALITGMEAPVVRGAIMASLFLFGEMLGRQRSAITALALAAALMVALDPQVLWTVPFQMSFLAMAGLILIFPKLQALGRRAIRAKIGDSGRFVSGANFLSDSFSVSLAAILTTWPLTAYYFGIISFTGLLANLLALPALPGIIVTGALTSVIGLIAPAAAQATGWLAWLFISYLVLVVKAFAAWPGSALQAGAGSTLLVWSYYPLLAVALWLSGQRGLHKSLTQLSARLKTAVPAVNVQAAKWAVPPLLVIAVLLSLAAATMPDKKLHVSVLDIGQGDAILIRTPARQDILIDGGPDTQAVIRELGRKMPFWDRTIDLVVLTHPHADHVTGLTEVLKRYRVKQVIYPDIADDSPVYQAWLGLVAEKGIKSVFAREGQLLELGDGAQLRVLAPAAIPAGQKMPSLDDSGVVLELVMGRVSFVFTADISEQAELGLAGRRAIPPGTVLKVAHHGSDTATSPGFLAVADPGVAVISAGADNRFGHPKPEVIGRLEAAVGPENIYRTDQQGTIEFTTDGQRLWVEAKESR